MSAPETKPPAAGKADGGRGGSTTGEASAAYQTSKVPQHHLEVEALATATRAASSAVTTAAALEQTVHALEAAARGDLARDVRKALELHRLSTHRLSAVVLQLQAEERNR